MFYGAVGFDPLYILAQIVAVQCLYYLGLGTALFVCVGPFVPTSLTTSLIFDYRAITVQTSVGVLTIVSFLAAGALGSVVLLVVVERAKKCLDHAVTCFLVHLLMSSASFGFPRRADWWMLHVVLVAVMAVLGEWLCIQKEMREIPIGSLGQQLRQQRCARAAAGGRAPRSPRGRPRD